MTLDGRDRIIVQLIARFNQLSSAHLREMVFADLKSHTPCDRSLRRLSERGFLARIERRNVGGSKGGSGQYVYQLGRLGHVLHRTGRYMPVRTINYHTLAIADAYVSLLRMQRFGAISIIGMLNEPDCWITIGSNELKPDMLVEITRPNSDDRFRMLLEIDMGTEGPKQIREKLQRYWQAFTEAAAGVVFPLIIFIAIDDYRAQELKWLIEQGPTDAQKLFRVMTQERFSTAF